MKCLCGYETEKEKFIELFPDCDAELPGGLFFRLFLPNEPHENTHHFSRIYACPKCGALKIEVPL